jgi:hypothetical protein
MRNMNRDASPDDETEPRPRRRSWLIATPALAFLVLALAWSGFWYYAAHRAGATIAAWRERELAAGRSYDCAQQDIGGFPFRIEVSCGAAVADFKSRPAPLRLTAPRISATAQIYDPQLIIGEVASPVEILAPGQPVGIAASFDRGMASLRGRPSAPQSLDAITDGLVATDRRGHDTTLLRLEHAEFHTRLAAGTVDDHPVLDVALSLQQARTPQIALFAQNGTDVDVIGVLRGLDDLRPKPWPEPLRQLQAAGGSIEITRARAQQGDVIATAAGTLRLTPAGRLDGELALTVAGLEQLLPALGLDRLLAQTAPGAPQNKINQGLSALDRLVPGLGDVARQQLQSPDTRVAMLSLLGQPTQLEGRRAIAVPLRFRDGAVLLGSIPVGDVPPLY